MNRLPVLILLALLPIQAFAQTGADRVDARAAAERFLEDVNDARVSLALNNPSLAGNYIRKAQEMATDAGLEKNPYASVETGRVAYDNGTARPRYHYFPLGAPVEVMTLKKGPFWARKGLAVTDAEVVYLSLDLSGRQVAKRLAQAQASLAAGKPDDAERQLADLTDAVIKIDDRVAMPLDKARDNLALARGFVAARNYDGARYALKHADDALNEMQSGNGYTGRRAEIASIRKEVHNLQATVRENDPTWADKANAKIAQWWSELRGWNKTKPGRFTP